MFRTSAGGHDETKDFNHELYSCAVDGNRILHVMSFNEGEAMITGNCMEDFDRLDEFHNAKGCFYLKFGRCRYAARSSPWMSPPSRERIDGAPKTFHPSGTVS